jgi:hypothetical protein
MEYKSAAVLEGYMSTSVLRSGTVLQGYRYTTGVQDLYTCSGVVQE